ncbi:regulator of DNA class I crossover intermediates 1 [Heliangelus exortis]|uniref:regulator of DNA class I crossover intermediates 1 n=1 Tax=Heliangelus exortis TaxID=472823 RepID=UPI003A91240C
MNWVGGSRSRIILKQERRKQKEFFEKKKLKSKMKLLGVSSPKSSAVSLDLLNLYVVNQISVKKDNTENPRKPVHIDITENVKIPGKRHNIELPMSPPRMKHLSNLDDIQNRLQQQVLDSRRQHLSEKVKCHNLPQVTDLRYADSSMEHQDNIARSFSACPLSSSGFWSPNCSQFSEENYNTNLMGSTWEQTYEEKLQNQTGNSFAQDPWITKPPSHCIFTKSDTVPQELFNPLHRLDCMNSTRKNPVIMTSNESENSEGIKELLFDVVKETAELKAPQDGSDCSFLALFEDVSKPIQNIPSTEHFNPFVNQSSGAIFTIDTNDGNQMTNRNYQYDTREAYCAISATNNSVDRHLEGVFTAPEQLLFKSNDVSSANYEQTSGHHKTHLQDCYEGQHYFIPSENKEKPANLEKIETFGYHHDHQINLKENLQNHFRKNSEDESVNESAWRQRQPFGYEQFTAAQEKEYKPAVSSNLHKTEKDVESSLSSQSPSYSPRQTESCFSSSPDTSEEEDTAKKKEYINEQSLKITDDNLVSASARTETIKIPHTRTLPVQPCNILTGEEATRIQEKSSILCAPEEENEKHSAPTEGNSPHQAFKREHITGSTRCDGWSQTESSVSEVEKVDVATQCESLQLCSCGSFLPSARSPGRVPPPGTSGTAGGQEMPAAEAQQPAGTGRAAGPAVLPPEAEYLSLAGRTLQVLSYIDKMKERDKQ